MSYCISDRRVLLVALAAAPFLLAGEAFASGYMEEAVDPVLTLVGKSEVTVAKGGTFTDPGAICTGKHVNEAGHKTVMGTPAVSTSAVGTYTLTYKCTDTRGVVAPNVDRTVKVVAKPVITLIGDANVTEEWGRSYTDPGATCSGDAIPGGSKKAHFDPISSLILGKNTLTYRCTDTRGISADPVTRTLTMTATPPTIALNGAASATIQLGHAYDDPGANCSGEFVNVWYETVYADTTNLSLGENTLTYQCTDTRGITSDRVTRTLTATAPPSYAPPTLTLNGDASVVVELPGPDTQQVRNAAYTDPGATCSGDTIPGGSKTVYAGVTSLSLGSNTLTYSCIGSVGKLDPVTITRTVTLVITPPTIALNGDADAVHYGVQSNWRDLGATCKGEFIDGGSKTVYSAHRTIHPELIGKHTLTYACTDSRGVSAATVTGTVYIYGKPLHIELKGDSVVTITQGESWTDPGALCKYGGYSYAWVVYSGDSVNTQKTGTYTLDYKCQEYFGKWSDPVTRTVKVTPSASASCRPC